MQREADSRTLSALKGNRNMEATQPTVSSYETVLREYENANRVYMSTSVFTAEGKRAKDALEKAREKYIDATKAAHPNWSVI